MWLKLLPVLYDVDVHTELINLQLYNSILYIIGTYGTVFKAKNRESQEIVALKRVRLDDDDEVCMKFY